MKAKITPRNILAVLQAYFRRAKVICGFNLPTHTYEQIIWRRTQVMEKSTECWESGSCVVCGCEILGKTMEDRACGVSESEELLAEGIKPCFPAMMDKVNWKKYKELYNIKLFD